MNPLTLVYLFFAGTFLSLYFNKKLVKFYKNKWIMYGFVLFSGLAANQIYDFYKSQTNAPEKVSFEAQAIIAENDLLITSSHGYSVIVPAGYKYITSNDALASLYAEKKSSDNKSSSTIAITVTEAKKPLSKMMPGLVEKLKKNYNDFNYSEKTKSSEDKVLRFSFKTDENKNYGLIRFIVRDKLLFTITTLSKNPGNNSYPPELEKAVESFAIK